MKSNRNNSSSNSSSNHSTSSIFEILPKDMVNEVFEYLDLEDLVNLRSTSKQSKAFVDKLLPSLLNKILTPIKVIEMINKYYSNNKSKPELLMTVLIDLFRETTGFKKLCNQSNNNNSYGRRNNLSSEEMIVYALTTDNIHSINPEDLEKALKEDKSCCEEIKASLRVTLGVIQGKNLRDLLSNLRIGLDKKDKELRDNKYKEYRDQLPNLDDAFLDALVKLVIGIKDKNKYTKVNLRGANLQEAYLADLDISAHSFFDLSGADLSSATLVGATLSAKLSGAKLIGVNAKFASFEAADLSEAKLNNGNFTNANFTDTNLTNADCEKATMNDAKLIRTRLTGANMNKAILSNVCVENVDFSRANLSGCNLSQCTAYIAYGGLGNRFQNANFTNTHFTGTNIEWFLFFHLIPEDDNQFKKELDNFHQSVNSQQGEIQKKIRRKGAQDIVDAVSEMDDRTKAIRALQMAIHHPAFAKHRNVGKEAVSSITHQMSSFWNKHKKEQSSSGFQKPLVSTKSQEILMAKLESLENSANSNNNNNVKNR